MTLFSSFLSNMALAMRYKNSQKKQLFEPLIDGYLIQLELYLLATFASILIASPLPTEIGIMLMTSIKKISIKKFVIIVYVLHASAIFIILLIGSTI